MGAPTVGCEKLDSFEAQAAVQAALAAYRSEQSSGDTEAGSAPDFAAGEQSGAAAGINPATAAPAQLAAVMCGEVGGGNGLEPLLVGARMGLPVLDGDLMGRAFPELQASRGGRGVRFLHVGLIANCSCMRPACMLASVARTPGSRLQMMSSAIYGLPITPAAVADEKGNRVVVQRCADAAWLERLLRPVCTEMGCSAGFSSRPLTGGRER